MASRRVFVFLHYSYAHHLASILLDLLPPVIRTLLYQMALAECGRRPLIDYGVHIRYP